MPLLISRKFSTNTSDMKKVIPFFILFITTTLFAQKPMEIKLWPDGTPNTNQITGKELELEKNRISNVTEPTLTVYLPSKTNGKMILMCPGGGYARLAIDHEGHDMAAWFNAQGIGYAVLKYRLPNQHSEIPLSDAEQAIKIIRNHAEEWGINPNQIGVMGASAGGHLASTLATHYSSEATRPDFQILLYPVISMDETITHGGSRKNLIGENPSQELIEKYSNELQVTQNTPPAFITLSHDDKSVPAENSIRYYLNLLSYGIPTSLHIYPIGGHGWGFRDNFIYKKEWTGELEKWLRELN